VSEHGGKAQRERERERERERSPSFVIAVFFLLSFSTAPSAIASSSS
jgi:hypothetical protein